jgi:CDP-glucose 4,6-dehydratase
MHPNFWHNRPVFVTGHTGFKGSWLALWLQSLGARVTGYSLAPPTQANFFTLAEVGQGMQTHQGDLLDLTRLLAVVAEAEPEVLFHLAAQPLVRRSYDAPIETFAVNVLGTAHVLEAARAVPSLRAIVVITTDKCYENKELERGYHEGDRLGGHDPYSASKACAELVTAAYRRSFLATPNAMSVGVATARAGNVIGGGDFAADRILPDAVRAIEAGVPLCVRQPHAVRPWQHVLEPLAGYLLLAERLASDPQRHAEAWNFGPAGEECVSVATLLEHFYRCWGGGRWESHTSARPLHETRYLRLDATKARQALGWRPQLPLHEAVDWTVQWYKAAVEQQSDLAGLARKQIQQYQELLHTAQPAQPGMRAA